MGARPTADIEPVTLDNCDREPIHIPGAIQPHGALLAFDAGGCLHAVSDNAPAMLGPGLPALGEPLRADHLGSVVADAVAAARERGSESAGMVDRYELALGSRVFDLLVHHNGAAVIAEFELRQDDGSAARSGFSAIAYASMARLRQQRTVQDLLDAAVAELRTLTGFDRVMAYRFRHDASGDVVAESRRDDLEPFLNRRYPASDIPAQARRLYLLNTVRQIGDARARAVAIVAERADPLDMSWCSLRAVSPIHLEYLGNMGVAASMSVSIVIGGQLWGMLACHHMAPKVVPHAVRTAADVLGQLLASSVQTLLSAETARHLAAGGELRVRLIEQVTHSDDALRAIQPFAAELCSLFAAHGLVISEGTETCVHGGVDAQAGADLVRWLAAHDAPGSVVAVSSQSAMAPALAAVLGTWAGFLALRSGDGWLVLLRREQIETVEWGGRPMKAYTPGPNGPRLTPRGSFDVWRETVRGSSVPWSDTERELAASLSAELQRACAARQTQMAAARDQMLAVLGHDLRGPLQTIAMASQLLERGGDSQKISRHISRSSSQMARLITDVLDVSRLRSGLGLGVQPAPVDLAALLQDVVKESRIAHPGVEVLFVGPASLVAPADPDRVRQLLDNLLGNARNHGEPGRPIRLDLRQDGGAAEIAVANHGSEIPPEVARDLFNPYKRQSVGNPRNRGGLGLGLYIASEIAQAHGGSLDYAWQPPCVVFTCRLPLGPDA
jgi:light-regulated signal transduction histidine kinase (bacteriophytochrome)